MNSNKFAEQLDEINKVYKERAPQHTASEKENGEPNIFEILGIENKEVLICRILGDLLNPNGKINGGNDEPLKLFLEEVLGVTPENDFNDAEIVLEEVTDENRRVDIVIKIGGEIYPIEVKIWAEDQPSQLFDYYHFYFGEETSKKIYYLTPTGKEPSNNSIRNLHKEAYKPISFEKDVFHWLNSITLDDFNETAKFIITQFKEVVYNMSQDAKAKEALKNALGYSEETGYQYNELLLTILNNHDFIEKSIQQVYIRNHCDLADTSYTLSANITKDDKKKDSHCVLKVLDDAGNTIAWICIATNLYIVTEKIKEQASIDKRGKKGWDDSKAGNNYYWRYLYYKTNETLLAFKNIKEYLDNTEDIAIKKALEDCE